MALWLPFSIWQTQCVEDFLLLKSAPFCKLLLFAGHGSTIRTATFLAFSSFHTPTPSSLRFPFLSPCFRFVHFGISHFFCGVARSMSWPGRLRSCSHLQFYFFSCIHSSHFSDWRRTVSSKFFDTQVPAESNENPVFPRHS